jgi:hypothetical protein
VVRKNLAEANVELHERSRHERSISPDLSDSDESVMAVEKLASPQDVEDRLYYAGIVPFRDYDLTGGLVFDFSPALPALPAEDHTSDQAADAATARADARMRGGGEQVTHDDSSGGVSKGPRTRGLRSFETPSSPRQKIWRQREGVHKNIITARGRGCRRWCGRRGVEEACRPGRPRSRRGRAGRAQACELEGAGAGDPPALFPSRGHTILLALGPRMLFTTHGMLLARDLNQDWGVQMARTGEGHGSPAEARNGCARAHATQAGGRHECG